jgi:transcription termination factor Rho
MQDQDENNAPTETLEPDAVAETPIAEVEAPEAADAGEGADEPSEVAKAIAAMGLTRMSLQELKDKSPADLLSFAETLEIENANSMRKQDMMFAILKTLAEEGVEIAGSGTLEVVQDGFGFLRSPEANYLPGPDDIYVSPSQIRKFGLRTGDSVEGGIRAPREGET